MTDGLPDSFADLNLIFTPDNEGCVLCNKEDLSCHNNWISSFDGQEYNVHISTNTTRTKFHVSAVLNPSTVSPLDIDANFKDEKAAARFVCKNFLGFKCV
ncbi:MAG: hypothetical protein BGO32_07065 [Bacteroidetes bacterium 37-13]|nr:MAG: hypothetical protein BGO32_07065 [Bacteroidetes bacterium 37-13]